MHSDDRPICLYPKTCVQVFNVHSSRRSSHTWPWGHELSNSSMVCLSGSVVCAGMRQNRTPVVPRAVTNTTLLAPPGGLQHTYWFALGQSGLKVRAFPYLERADEGIPLAATTRHHDVLNRIRVRLPFREQVDVPCRGRRRPVRY